MQQQALSGVGNTPSHQFLISHLLIGINDKFKKNPTKFKNYRVVPEFDAPNGKNPDLSVYILAQPKRELVCVVEICRNYQTQSNAEKVAKMLYQTKTIKEGYVFDCDNFVLYKINLLPAEKSSKKIQFEMVETEKINFINFSVKTPINKTKKDLNII